MIYDKIREKISAAQSSTIFDKNATTFLGNGARGRCGIEAFYQSWCYAKGQRCPENEMNQFIAKVNPVACTVD